MAEKKRCPHCHTYLPADAPRGVCPQCLLKVGMVGEPEIAVDGHPIIEGPGTKIGQYELLELIGEGGMGLVYLAEQTEPVKRNVALKIVKLGMDTKQVVARFEAERQTLALLEHPNIAHVFNAGTTEAGRPYFVMEYVEGKSITKYCDEQQLSVEQRLGLFQQICDGVHYAHQKGIIHRDIKPSNILVSVHSDKAIPKIIDFGIAKAITQPLTEKTSYTEHGQLLGTPEYMSPEQAEMAYEEVDTRSDIYSLGVVLYELLTGVTPFDAKRLREGGIDHIQQVICQEEPRTPSAQLASLGDKAKAVAKHRRTQIITLTRCLHRELEWIPMKAMRKDRTRRYRSASELADDIQNYLTGTPLIAGPESTIYRARKFVRKHAGSVATAVLLSGVVVVGLVVSILMGCRAEQARQEEAAARRQVEQALVRAEKAEELARERADKYKNLSYLHSVALADAKYHERNLNNVLRLLKSCPEDLRNWEWFRLNYVMDEAILTLDAGGGPVTLSPDGKQIAVGQMGSQMGSLCLWDITTGSKTMILKGRAKTTWSPAFSPDGKRVASGSNVGTITVWDAQNGTELMTLEGHSARVMSVVFSPDGKRIVSGSFDDTVKVWDTETGKELLTLQGAGKLIFSVAISPDGKRIIAGNRTSKITEWDAETGEVLRNFSIPDQAIIFVAYSPDGRQIAVTSDSGMIRVLDAVTGVQVCAPEGYTGKDPVFSVGFSPDGKRLVSGGVDNTVKVWSTVTGEELTTLVGHAGGVVFARFCPDSRRIISQSFDRTIKVWDPDVDKDRIILEGHQGMIRSVAFSPSGRQLVSASMDKTLKVWDVSTAKEMITLAGHDGEVWCTVFSPDGKCIASSSSDKTVRIWDAASGHELRKLTGHDLLIYSVAFSPDGKRIVSGSNDKTIKVWDVSTGQEQMTLSGHPHSVHSVVFSPDGKLIASGDAGLPAPIKLWDASTGKELKTLSGHSQSVSAVLFTPDGRWIISGSYDGTIRVWDVETGDNLMALYGHKGNVESLAISPDGERLVSGSHDHTTKVWDVATGAELMTLPGGGSFGVAFSPDGRSIAGGCGPIPGDITIWQSVPRPAMGRSDQCDEYEQVVVD